MNGNNEQKELFTISPHPNAQGFEMMLRGGIVDVPDEGGCYVVSTGCGSGKTESIKSLIRQHYGRGIVYCVDTRAELQKMYAWILSNLCNRPDTDLTENDVMMLCSTTDEDTADLKSMKGAMVNQYLDNPWCLMSKKILLLTHVRFWTDLINFFLIYNPENPKKVGAFDGNFESLMRRDDLRGYVLFDETPTFIKPFAAFPRPLIGLFSDRDATGEWHCKDDGGRNAAYDTFLRGTSFDLFKQTYKVNKIKKDVVLNLIPRNFHMWLKSRDDLINLYFTPADLSQPIVNTHAIIFEGAGEILIGDTKQYRILDIHDKYLVHVEFNPFNWSLHRRRKNNQDVECDLQNVSRMIDSADGQTLVVVWKNMGVDNTDDSIFYEQAKQYLEEHASRPFHITYYGAADTKSTNEYRDFKNIVLCGGWSIPEVETAKFRSHYMSETTNEMHRLWYFVQLLCRIGIRKRDGGHYRVFYSTDFPKDFISRLSQYFNNNTSPLANPEQTYWRKKIKNANIRKEVADRIDKLCHAHPELKNIIESDGDKRIFCITLDELYCITPTGKDKEKRKYEPLRKALELLGVELIIESSKVPH